MDFYVVTVWDSPYGGQVIVARFTGTGKVVTWLEILLTLISFHHHRCRVVVLRYLWQTLLSSSDIYTPCN